MARDRADKSVVWRPGLCPFDGQPIELFDATVQCPECDTFHHADCWEFNGRRCARLGCHGATSFAMRTGESQ